MTRLLRGSRGHLLDGPGHLTGGRGDFFGGSA
jgi:hypothetical protein